jgi:glycosyltransferase involved in cell wall biosynthesis
MRLEQPVFSIVVPTYERPRQLAACLQALARLDYARDNFEVIVVDDGGKTPLDNVIAPFHDRLSVTLLAQSNAGPAVARNTGAAQAKGQFLAFTDDDCRPAPDWLKSLAVRLAKDRTCIIGGRTINALPDNPYSRASQILIDYLYSYYNSNPDRARFLTSNNLALAADSFRAIGGFDTTYPRAAAEDRELCDRWLSKGYLMIYASEVIVHHAHPLTFRTFWRQHFWYGRGAFSFHCIRARRGAGRVKVEPLAFYLNLLRYPLSRARGVQALYLTSLLVVTQLATVAGFFLERRKTKEG